MFFIMVLLYLRGFGVIGMRSKERFLFFGFVSIMNVCFRDVVL